MRERGCTAVMLFVATFVLGTIATTLLVLSTSGGGGGPDVGGAIASFGLLSGLVGGLVFATIATVVALYYMKKS